MRLLGRVRLLARMCLVLLLGLTLWAWAATRSTPWTFVAERFRLYSAVSHQGVLRLSVTERLRSDRATGEEHPVAYGPAWRVRPPEEWPDDFIVGLALERARRGSFAVARDVYGLTAGIPGGSPDFDWTRPRTAAVMFPHWAAAIALGLGPGVWLLRRTAGSVIARRRARAGRCPDCGYDLRGSEGQCPEMFSLL